MTGLLVEGLHRRAGGRLEWQLGQSGLGKGFLQLAHEGCAAGLGSVTAGLWIA